MQRFRHWFTAPSNVFRGMLTLAAGTAGAKVIGFVVMPLLTRLYTPEQMGLLSIFTACIAMGLPALSLRYVIAIPLPHHDGLALNLVVASAVLIVSSTALLSMILAFVPDRALAQTFLAPVLTWRWLLLAGLFFASSYEVLSMWATRRRRFSLAARAQVLQSAAGESSKLIAAFTALGTAGLLLGPVVSSFTGIAVLFIRFSSELCALRRHVRWRRIKLVLGHYRDFPLFRLPSQFLLAFSAQVLVLVVATLYGTAMAGQLGLALLAVGLPTSLLSNAVGSSFYAEVSRLGKHRIAEVRKLSLDVQRRLLLLGAPVAAGIYFAAPHFFSLVFGSEWRQAGDFAAVLALYLAFQLASAPLMQSLNIVSGQQLYLVINCVRATVVVMSLYLAYRLGAGPSDAVFAYSVTASIFYIGVGWMIAQKLKSERQRVRK